jgi:hypothetical protein
MWVAPRPGQWILSESCRYISWEYKPNHSQHVQCTFREFPQSLTLLVTAIMYCSTTIPNVQCFPRSKPQLVALLDPALPHNHLHCVEVLPNTAHCQAIILEQVFERPFGTVKKRIGLRLDSKSINHWHTSLGWFRKSDQPWAQYREVGARHTTILRAALDIRRWKPSRNKVRCRIRTLQSK